MKSPFTRRPNHPETGAGEAGWPPCPAPAPSRDRPARRPARGSAPSSPAGEGGDPILVLGDGRTASLSPGSTHQLGGAAVDICFVFDTTGSMSDKITGLIRAMSDLVAELASLDLDWRVTTVAFGDLTVPGDRIDDSLGFVTTRAAAQDQLRSMPRFGGGGNGGESSIEAMLAGVRRPWRQDAVKIIVLLTDEPALSGVEIRPDLVAAELRRLDAVCFRGVTRPRLLQTVGGRQRRPMGAYRAVHGHHRPARLAPLARHRRGRGRRAGPPPGRRVGLHLPGPHRRRPTRPVTSVTDRGEFCDFYELLGVAPDADSDQIDDAFRAQVRIWHPDTNPDPAAPARMVALNEAQAVLGDPTRRAGFDRCRKARQVPDPRLSPSSVDFGVIHPDRTGPTVTVRVLNDGGTPATVRVDPEIGRFWKVVAVRGGAVPGELAQLDLAGCASSAHPGPQTDRLRVLCDDRPAEVALTAVVTEPNWAQVMSSARPARCPGPSRAGGRYQPCSRRGCRGRSGAVARVTLRTAVSDLRGASGIATHAPPAPGSFPPAGSAGFSPVPPTPGVPGPHGARRQRPGRTRPSGPPTPAARVTLSGP